MGCPHRSHLVKTASIGPTPLSVSGALLLYSLRLLSQFLIRAPSLLYRRDRLAHPAQPGPGPLSPVLGDEPHELAPDNHPVGLRRRLGRRLRRLVQEAPGAPGEDGVVVEQEHHGHAVREAGGEGQAVAEVCPVLDGAGGGVLDGRPVGQRVGEGNPYLQHVGPGSEERLPHLGRPVKRRVAAGEVRHEGRASPRESPPEPLSPAHEGSSPASRASMPKASATTPMSLSPRPERLMTRFLPGPSSRATFSAWWMACEVSSAGMIPSRREHITKASNASSSVAPTYSTRPSSLR